MPYPIEALPRDKNHEAIPVLRHDYAGVFSGNDGVGATVLTLNLTSTTVAVCPSTIYRIVGNTTLFFKHGAAGTAAVTDGSQTYLVPDLPELILTGVGHTLLAVASPFASGGKVYVQRMVGT